MTAMHIAHFHKATDPASMDAVHINTDAVLFVEELPESQIGKTFIQVSGLRKEGIRITEPLGEVLAHIPALASAFRHYHAGAPPEGASEVHIALNNVSYILPNVSLNPAYWTLHFRDESELRIVDPLPTNL
jgi:hypothetical protein